MCVIYNVVSTLFMAALNLIAMPSFWCVMVVLSFELIPANTEWNKCFFHVERHTTPVAVDISWLEHLCCIYQKFNTLQPYWWIVNSIYSFISLFGKVLNRILFGELQIPEDHQSKDKFWNYVFYKFIFIFGVLNVQYMEEVLAWVTWFALLGVLHLISQTCQDRLEYISYSAVAPQRMLWRMMILLSSILIICAALYTSCIYHSADHGLNYFLLISAELVLVSINAAHVLTRYATNLYDIRTDSIWENRNITLYNIDLYFTMASLIMEFSHDLHMLLWGNVFFSMASVVISMRLHCTVQDMKKRFNKHHVYTKIAQQLNDKYPMADKSILVDYDDNCAICWDGMKSARVLPCGHLFHHSCLRSWLEQDTSCPKCRLFLDIGDVANVNLREILGVEATTATPTTATTNTQTNNNNNNINNLNNNNLNNNNNNLNMSNNVPAAATAAHATVAANITNHVFHFDGSRYISWLPTVSVEVSRTTTPITSVTEEDATRVLQLSLDVGSSIEEVILPEEVEDIKDKIPLVDDTADDLGQSSSRTSSTSESDESEDDEDYCTLTYQQKKERLIARARRIYLEKHKQRPSLAIQTN